MENNRPHGHRGWKPVICAASSDLPRIQVTEETVLEDNAGLHIGGGPFCLFYSRSTKVGDPAYTVMPWDWPDRQKVRRNTHCPWLSHECILIPRQEGTLTENAALREKLAPEIAAELKANELQTQRPDDIDESSRMSLDPS